jgi:hypothetical protein
MRHTPYTNTLTALPLALVAVIALSAMTASAASAHSITAGEYPANVTGVQTNTNVFSNGVREWTCSEASLTGSLSAASESITITPSYGGCTGNSGTTVTVDVNGCRYVTVVTGTGTATLTLQCPVGKSIEWTIWETGKVHSETRLCTLNLPPQGPISGLTFSNNAGPGGISWVVHVTGLLVVRMFGTAANCGAAEKTTGTLTGNVTATAKNSLGTAISLMAE